MALSGEQAERYSRQISLPEIGSRGQQRLLGAKVLVAGAGGLGSAAALYLAAAGVGTIGIADSDVVVLSNLQRQILHSTPDLGQPKTQSAARRLRELNPEIKVIEHPQRLVSDNILGIIEGYEFVIDATDNFPTRYLINDACVAAGRGLASGAVMRFEGQVTTVAPGRGPCYRCLHPKPPPAGLVPSGPQAGILGAVAGLVGTIQAVEAIKWILGVGDLLVGRLLICDALAAKFRQVRVKRDPKCAACGEHPTLVSELRDMRYNQ